MLSFLINTGIMMMITTAIIFRSNTPPRILTVNQNNAETISTEWICKIKDYELPIYTLFPFYDVASTLNERKQFINNESDCRELLLICEQEFYSNNTISKPGIASLDVSHLCIAYLNVTDKYLYINKILLNPDIIFKNQNCFVNSSIILRDSLLYFASSRKFKINFNKTKTWDNGRFFLLMNEDKIF